MEIVIITVVGCMHEWWRTQSYVQGSGLDDSAAHEVGEVARVRLDPQSGAEGQCNERGFRLGPTLARMAGAMNEGLIAASMTY
jgi:hypothetical protein